MQEKREDSNSPRSKYVCAYCHQEIEDVEFALFAWKVKDSTGESFGGKILHKGLCDVATTEADDEAQEKGLYHWVWQELAYLLRGATNVPRKYANSSLETHNSLVKRITLEKQSWRVAHRNSQLTDAFLDSEENP